VCTHGISVVVQSRGTRFETQISKLILLEGRKADYVLSLSATISLMAQIEIDLLERIRLCALLVCIQTVCVIKEYLLNKIFWSFIPKFKIKKMLLH
jgi:hypothetical protein